MMEPQSNGHVGTRHLVLYREVVLSSKVKMKLLCNRKVNFWDLVMCPLSGGFPIVSFIRGSTVLNMIAECFKGL